MVAIAFFGVLIVVISATMIIDPDKWSDTILAFSRLRYFHAFEIVSRLIAGALFVRYAEASLYPAVMTGFGYLMMAVGIGLLLVGTSLHQRFAAWSASKLNRFFRPAAFAAAAFGLFIVYGVVQGP